MSNTEDTLSRINSLINAVYRQRRLNPWTTAHERTRALRRLFSERLNKWPLRDLTDLEYGNSTAVAFLLHPGYYIGVSTKEGIEVLINRLGGRCYWSLVEISHIGPFARVRFTCETYDRSTKIHGYQEQTEPFREEDFEFWNLLKDLLNEQGIEILTEEILMHPIPDLRLDMTEIGDVTVYHCLFEE